MASHRCPKSEDRTVRFFRVVVLCGLVAALVQETDLAAQTGGRLPFSRPNATSSGRSSKILTIGRLRRQLNGHNRDRRRACRLVEAPRVFCLEALDDARFAHPRLPVPRTSTWTDLIVVLGMIVDVVQIRQDYLEVAGPRPRGTNTSSIIFHDGKTWVANMESRLYSCLSEMERQDRQE